MSNPVADISANVGVSLGANQYRLLGQVEVAAILGVTTAALRKKYLAGEMPRPMWFGKVPRWSAPVLVDWLTDPEAKAKRKN